MIGVLDVVPTPELITHAGRNWGNLDQGRRVKLLRGVRHMISKYKRIKLPEVFNKPGVLESLVCCNFQRLPQEMRTMLAVSLVNANGRYFFPDSLFMGIKTPIKPRR